MLRRLVLAAFAIGLPIIAIASQCADARAAEKFPCEAFVRVGDGSWQAITTTLIPQRNFRVQEGSLWRPGATVLGVDMASTLEKECPNAPVGLPENTAVPATPGMPAAPGMSQRPPSTQVPLARYADANGNIDVRSLTCGQFDDASPQETDVLLAWYSGRVNASAKSYAINLPRVRYAMRSVADYCRANPEKNLSQVMELMLK